MPRPSLYEFAGGDQVEWATREVNSYSPAGARVDPDLPMPRWSWDGLEPP